MANYQLPVEVGRNRFLEEGRLSSASTFEQPPGVNVHPHGLEEERPEIIRK